jgi:uncharacterized membrane protein
LHLPKYKSKKVKILGHPVHLMLIHFPAALFPAELIFYYIYYRTGSASFGNASFYAMCVGAIAGWLAIITGAIDLITIEENQGEAKAKAWIHGSINGTVVFAYSILAYMLYNKYPVLPAATLMMLLVKAGLNALMIAGNYVGGTLILKYKIATHN